MDVYFVFLTNSSDGINMKYSELVDGLLSYSNIHLRYLYPKEFSKGTKLENFFEREAMNASLFPVGHAADIVRVLILNKYGGQYLDLDIISLMPITAINRVNYACAESENMVANGVMNLDTDELGGKKFSEKYLQ
jgi:mannosyltransferase OCH1-like enzyme